MTSLSDTVSTVVEGVDQLSRRTEVAGQLRLLDSIDESVDRLLTLLGSVEEMWSVAQTGDFAPSLEGSQGLIEAARLIARTASDEGGLESAQRHLSAASEKVQVADALLVQSWRDYLSAQLPPLDGLSVLAETFTLIEEARHAASNLKTALREARALASERPSVQALARLEALRMQLPDLLQSLVGDNTDVRTFADELARGGASIAALTPQVMDWMERSGFNQSFKVVAGRPADRTPQ